MQAIKLEEDRCEITDQETIQDISGNDVIVPKKSEEFSKAVLEPEL